MMIFEKEHTGVKYYIPISILNFKAKRLRIVFLLLSL